MKNSVMLGSILAMAMFLLMVGMVSAYTVTITAPAASAVIDGAYNFTTTVAEIPGGTNAGVVNVTFWIKGPDGIWQSFGTSTNSSANQTTFSKTWTISTFVDTTYTINATAGNLSTSNIARTTNTGVVFDGTQISATYDSDSPSDNDIIKDVGKYIRITSASGEDISAATLNMAGNVYPMNSRGVTNDTQYEYILDAMSEGAWEYYIELQDTNTTYSSNTATRTLTIDFTGVSPAILAAQQAAAQPTDRSKTLLVGILIMFGFYLLFMRKK